MGRSVSVYLKDYDGKEYNYAFSSDSNFLVCYTHYLYSDFNNNGGEADGVWGDIALHYAFVYSGNAPATFTVTNADGSTGQATTVLNEATGKYISIFLEGHSTLERRFDSFEHSGFDQVFLGQTYESQYQYCGLEDAINQLYASGLLPPTVEFGWTDGSGGLTVNDVTVEQGMTFTSWLSLTASADNGVLSCQWYKDDTVISTDTDNASTLTSNFKPSASETGEHTYYCVVIITGSDGTVTNIQTEKVKVTVTSSGSGGDGGDSGEGSGGESGGDGGESGDDTGGETTITINVDSLLKGWRDGRKIVSLSKSVKFGTWHDDVIPEGGVYYIGVTSASPGDYASATATLSAGDAFPGTVNDGDVYVFGDYEYRYNMHINLITGRRWFSVASNGWGVSVIDANKTEYGTIIDGINSKPITTLSHTFRNCKNLVSTDGITIPRYAKNLQYAFYGCTALVNISNLKLPTVLLDMTYTFYGCTVLSGVSTLKIPSSVETMKNTFAGCDAITKAPDLSGAYCLKNMNGTFASCNALESVETIPANVENLVAICQNCVSLKKFPKVPAQVTSLKTAWNNCENLVEPPDLSEAVNVTDWTWTFDGCTSLTGTIHIATESVPEKYSDCFYGTEKPITLTGIGTEANMAVLELLAETANNGNVSIAE